jgi:hypothetical protein
MDGREMRGGRDEALKTFFGLSEVIQQQLLLLGTKDQVFFCPFAAPARVL